MFQVNTPLLELLRAHDVDSSLQGEWISLPNRLRANASIVREMKQPTGVSIQLDVRLEIAPGRTIIESFAGVGETRDQASAEALHNFAANSLHVLLAAFLQRKDEQVSQEEWTIGGRSSLVTSGNIGVRGTPPAQGEQFAGWFKEFENRLKQKSLGHGTHWVRLYYGQMQSKAVACEVLLDNDVWHEMQSDMSAIAWPAGEQFYSVRVFLVIQAKNGRDMISENAVARLAEIVGPRQEFSEDEVYAAMAQAGMAAAVAGRAYNFTQTAWARAFLTSLGVEFSPEYVCFNASGEVMESGRLADEPSFAAASQLVERYAGTPGFRRLALMSAEADAANNALDAGGKPEDLIMGPAFLFLEAPTRAGMDNAQRLIAQRMAALHGPATPPAPPPPTPAQKPWWRFWG